MPEFDRIWICGPCRANDHLHCQVLSSDRKRIYCDCGCVDGVEG